LVHTWAGINANEVEQVLASLATRHGVTKTPRLRQAVWVLESALFAVAAESQTGGERVLDRFFAGYWPATRRELEADVSTHPNLLAAFDDAVGEVAARIHNDALSAGSDSVAQNIGHIVADWYEAVGVTGGPVGWVGFGAEYSSKLIAAAKFLNTVQASAASAPA
jgi:hypothetical protein